MAGQRVDARLHEGIDWGVCEKFYASVQEDRTELAYLQGMARPHPCGERMAIETIRNDEDLKRAFRWLEEIFQVAEGAAQGNERDALVSLIEAYESKHCDFGPADPADASKFRMEQVSRSPKRSTHS
jgi:hypothetical protein